MAIALIGTYWRIWRWNGIGQVFMREPKSGSPFRRSFDPARLLADLRKQDQRIRDLRRQIDRWAKTLEDEIHELEKNHPQGNARYEGGDHPTSTR